MKLKTESGSLTTERSFPGIPPLGFVLVTGLLTLSFFALISSTLIGLQLSEVLLRPNPFTEYQTIWPGQTVVSLAHYAQRSPSGSMTCHSTETPGEVDLDLLVQTSRDSLLVENIGNVIHCSSRMREGVFRSMHVTVSANHIQELVLFADKLHQDSLFLYWGAPDVIRVARTTNHLYLRWTHETYRATALVHARSGTVLSVTLTSNEPDAYSVPNTQGQPGFGAN